MPLSPYFAELASLGKKPPLLDKNGATGCLPAHTQPKSTSPCWHTHLTKGLCWMSVSRVFGLAWVKKKHLGSNYRSTVAINKAVTFTSVSYKLPVGRRRGRKRGKRWALSSHRCIQPHEQQAGSQTWHKHNTEAHHSPKSFVKISLDHPTTAN